MSSAKPPQSDSEGARIEEALAAAATLRSEGLELFQAGDVKKAMFKWHSMKLYLNGLDRSAATALGQAQGTAQSSLPPAQQAAIKELLIAAHNNLSLGLMKVEKFSRSLDEVTEALKLDENNVKALLRRAKVYCLAPAPTRDVEKATADLNHVLRLEPGNADARAMIANELKTLRAEDAARMAPLARKMFGASLG